MLSDVEIEKQIIKWTVMLVQRALGQHDVKIGFDFVYKPSAIAGYFQPVKRFTHVRFGFNMLIAKANWNEYYNTVVHEVAHLVDYARNNFEYRRFEDGRRDVHGAHFKAIMRELGEEPSTYHTYKMPGVRKQRRWEYKCACKTHSIATVTHNRIKNGQVRRCNTCKEVIKFTGVQLS